MADSKLRIFPDANIIIRGVTLPRFPYELLLRSAAGEFRTVVSPIVLESARYYVARLFPEHTGSLEAALVTLRPEVVPDPSLEDVAAHAGLVRDPKDVPVALAAIHAGVDYLVSTDRDFTDEDDSTAELRRRLKVMRVGSFLREVLGCSSEYLSTLERRSWAQAGAPFWER